MDVQLPPPDVVGIEVPVDSLDGTAKSLARAAQLAGYTIRATRALGPRLPRQRGQALVRIGSLALAGVKGHWRFTATWNTRDGWDVTQHRPGWPDTPGNIQTLRDTFKAQTARPTGTAA